MNTTACGASLARVTSWGYGPGRGWKSIVYRPGQLVQTSCILLMKTQTCNYLLHKHELLAYPCLWWLTVELAVALLWRHALALATLKRRVERIGRQRVRSRNEWARSWDTRRQALGNR